MIKIDGNQAKIFVDIKIYPLGAVYGASYVFINKAYVFIDINEKGKIIVFLKRKNDSSFKLKELAGEFLNELLHYTIRVKISKENNTIRKNIIERALFSSLALDQNCTDGYNDNPLIVAGPSEEKHGIKNKKK